MIDAPLLDGIAAIALEAGAAILAIRHGTFAVTTKADGTPVTQADLAANDIILMRLSERFAHIPIVSEETPQSKEISDARYNFIVDPLDGTHDFLNGAAEFTVNIALLERAAPVAGVIYAPSLGLIYVGAAGLGARRATVHNGALAAWSAISAIAPSGELRAVTSRSHQTSETRDFLDNRRIGNVVSVSSSLKFCIIAAGEADIYPRLGRTMEWDTAAGDAILRAAGGSVLSLDRKPLTYNKRDAAGGPMRANPWFVAAGSFNPFEPRWQRETPSAETGLKS